MSPTVALFLARENIERALNETKYLHDPMEAGVVANIRQSLQFALKELNAIQEGTNV